MTQRGKTPSTGKTILLTVSTILGIIVGLESIGWAMPWNTYTKRVADERYAQRELVEIQLQTIEEDVKEIKRLLQQP